VRYRIERESRQSFDQPVREHHIQVRLAPWESETQKVLSCALSIDPPAETACARDCFGNQVHRFALIGAHERLGTRLVAEVETRLVNPFDFEAIPPGREQSWIAHCLRQAPRLLDFVLHRSDYTPRLPTTLGETPPPFEPNTAILEQVQGAMDWIGAAFPAGPSNAELPAPLADLFETGRGGPPDLAHLLIALVRGWGVPARYATGYIDPGYFEPGEDAEDESAEPRPQTRHAWAEVLIPGAGWRGFDPSTGLLADDTYIGVAVGRDAADVPSERAVFKGEGSASAPQVELRVTRLD
jgi:transglutaminase-like putative cysteine protease